MAQHVEVTITDDIDNSPGAETVTFAFGRANTAAGRLNQYEIDLNPRNIAAFEKALAKYIEHGRKVTTARTRPFRARVRDAGPGHDLDTTAVRTWAAENDIAVNSRGRIAADVVARYLAAH